MRGTLSTLDDLIQFHGSIADFGEDATAQAVQDTIDAYNRVTMDMITDFVEVTDDFIRRFGGAANEAALDEIDEFGSPAPRKYAGGTNVGFPLRNYGASLQWTRKYFQNTMTQDFAVQVNDLLVADMRTLKREVAKAIFRPSNYSFNDRLTSRLSGNVTLPVKALLNADGGAIPPGPNGEFFDGTSHTHYFASASAGDPEVQTLIETVIEHYNAGESYLYINRAQENFVRARTGFVGYPDPRVHVALTTSYGNRGLDVIHLYNRAIGVLNGAEVWVKPWVPANYLFSWLKGQPSPVIMRKRKGGSGLFELVADDEEHPLRAQSWEREFGCGIWERTNGAVLYIGGGSYVNPTITG